MNLRLEVFEYITITPGQQNHMLELPMKEKESLYTYYCTIFANR